MAQDLYEHNNMILHVPNKRGVTKKGLPVIYKDTQKPSGYVLSKIDNDTIALENKNIRTVLMGAEDHIKELIEKHMGDIQNALTVARQYALSREQTLYLKTKISVDNALGTIIDNVHYNGINFPMLTSELEELSKTGQEIIIHNQGQRTYSLPSNTDIKILNNQTYGAGHKIDDYTLSLNNKDTNDFSHITFDTNTAQKGITYTLECHGTDDIKLPTIKGYGDEPEIKIEIKNGFYDDNLKAFAKEHKNVEINILNTPRGLIERIYRKESVSLNEKLLKNISDHHPDLITHIEDVKTFYQENPTHAKRKDIDNRLPNILNESATIPEEKLEKIKSVIASPDDSFNM